MNLYIFNEKSRATVFGIGTYISELIKALHGSNINICVLHLKSDKTQIIKEEVNNVQNWYFPECIQEHSSIDYNKQKILYYRNIVYLLKLHISDTSNLIFHLNYYKSSNLSDELRRNFDCRIVSVVHFSKWGFTVFDNLKQLRAIIRNDNPDAFCEMIIKTFEEEKLNYIKVDHVICLSYYMRKLLCNDYDIDVNKISVISNGLADVAITNTTEFLRKKWNISHRERIILFAGRIDEVKGVIYLIRAFRLVLEKRKNSRLIIAGSGNYDKYFSEAKDIYTKITFTGLLKKEELHELYKIADVGVVPSLFEPFGYVAVEMMMHELPIIATATSGLNEVVDETCGMKIPVIKSPDKVEINTELLAKKILYILQNPTEAMTFGQNGRKKYLRQYSSEVFRENMIKFYQSLFANDTKDNSSDMVGN